MTKKQTHTNHLWGIDLGGTKIECAVIASDSDKTVLDRQRVATESEKGYEQVLKNIRDLIDSVSRRTDSRPASLGIGTPGTLDPTSGLLRGSNSQNLQNKPVQEDLQKLLGIPVVIENDANCFALAEARMGAASALHANKGTVFGIIMGTGVGGGLVINGQLVSGKNLIAGEWGHNHLDASGGACYCGRTGCVETVISGPALESFYAAESGQIKTLPEIVSLADARDPSALKTMDRLVHFFGVGVSSIVNMIDPDVIVIGGGVGNINLLYSAGIEAIKKQVFSPYLHTTITRPQLGDSAGVFGAAFLTR